MHCYHDEQHFLFFGYFFNVAVFYFVLFSCVFFISSSFLACVASKDIHERRAAMMEIEQACPAFTRCFSASRIFFSFFSFLFLISFR